jgi:hypothetical protein
MRPFLAQKTRFALFFGAAFAMMLALSGGFDLPSLGAALIGGAIFTGLWVGALHLLGRRFDGSGRG